VTPRASTSFQAQDKTAKVEVTSFYVHSKYGKLMKRRKNFFAHDEHNLCGVGDRVQIKFVGQMSKKKQWAVIDMLYRHPQLAGEQFPMSKLAGSQAAHPPSHPADWMHPQKAAVEAASAR
jgi:small subunit ribosomal protein S17